jgi:hypothetical protein
MNLYLLTRPENDDTYDYDAYKNAVVCAESEQDALTINPSEEHLVNYDQEYIDNVYKDAWTSNPQATLIGKACDNVPRGVVMTHFLHG